MWFHRLFVFLVIQLVSVFLIANEHLDWARAHTFLAIGAAAVIGMVAVLAMPLSASIMDKIREAATQTDMGDRFLRRATVLSGGLCLVAWLLAFLHDATWSSAFTTSLLFGFVGAMFALYLVVLRGLAAWRRHHQVKHFGPR